MYTWQQVHLNRKGFGCILNKNIEFQMMMLIAYKIEQVYQIIRKLFYYVIPDSNRLPDNSCWIWAVSRTYHVHRTLQVIYLETVKYLK